MVGTQECVFRFGDVEVREREFRLIKAGEVIPVEPKAFRVLLFLLHNPQKLISKEQLLNAVWGETAVRRTLWLAASHCYDGCSGKIRTSRVL